MRTVYSDENEKINWWNSFKSRLCKALFVVFVAGYFTLFGLSGITINISGLLDNPISEHDYHAKLSDYMQQTDNIEWGGPRTAHSLEIQSSNRKRLPDTSGSRRLPDVENDSVPAIPGKETVLRGFRKQNIIIVIAYFKGKKNPYAFWKYNRSHENFDTYFDKDNDGVFESYVPSGKVTGILDLKAWGFD